MIRKRLGWGIIALGLGVLVGCGGGDAAKSVAKSKEQSETAAAAVVRVAEAQVRSMTQSLELTGSLSTLEDVSLSPKLSGRLTSVLVHEGDSVGAGQLVATQESTDLMTQIRQAEAGLAAARSVLLQAQSAAKISPQQTEAAVRQAEAQVKQARANLQKLQQGNRQQDIAQQQKTVEQAKLDWDWSVTDYNRLAELQQEGAVSKRQLDEAKVNMDKSRSRYESEQQKLSLLKEGARPEDIEAARQAVYQAEEALVQARASRVQDSIKAEQVSGARAQVAQAQASLQLARQQLDNTRIYSPVSGTVQKRLANPGQMLMAGSPILQIVSLNSVYFEGQVPESEIRWVTMGQSVTVKIDAYPGRAWTGNVAAINPVGNDQARLFNVRIALSGSGGKLRPGMFARGVIAVRTVPNAVVVPKDAIVARGGQTILYVIENNRARLIPAQTGLSTQEWIQVSGVQPGQQVVVQGADALSDGSRVQIQRTEGAPVASSSIR